MACAHDLRSLIYNDIDLLKEEIGNRKTVRSPSGGVRGLASLNRLEGRLEGLKMAADLLDEVFFSEWKVSEC